MINQVLPFRLWLRVHPALQQETGKGKSGGKQQGLYWSIFELRQQRFKFYGSYKRLLHYFIDYLIFTPTKSNHCELKNLDKIS